MSKNYAQIADDVVTGIGLLRQGADTVKAFGSAATATKALDTKTKGTDGARDRYRGSL
jgi:hypothetical protein